MVQLYGKRYVGGTTNADLGVVLRDNPEDSAPKARATVAETYDQIWKDIDKAQELLTGKTASNKTHFSLATVKGLKARIALVQQDYTKAAQFAKEARTGFSLMSQADYKSGFNNYLNTEWMWGIKIISDQSDYF